MYTVLNSVTCEIYIFEIVYICNYYDNLELGR